VVPTGDSSQSHRFPNSVTQHGDLVYVLNSADEGSITGFRLSPEGMLTPIPDSTRLLNANQTRFPPDALFNPTQVSFTPDGGQLVVAIKDGPPADPTSSDTPTWRGDRVRDGLAARAHTRSAITQPYRPLGCKPDDVGASLSGWLVAGTRFPFPQRPPVGPQSLVREAVQACGITCIGLYVPCPDLRPEFFANKPACQRRRCHREVVFNKGHLKIPMTSMPISSIVPEQNGGGRHTFHAIALWPGKKHGKVRALPPF
jgi:hypothetical protein